MTAVLTTPVGRVHPGRVADVPDPEVPEKAKRRRFTAEYKLAILEEYDRLTEPGAKGALLRREGLYSSLIVEWRRARDVGALQALGRPRGRKPADRRDVEVERLRRRNERLEAELAKARLIIDVQGKVSALLETISESAEPPKDSTR